MVVSWVVTFGFKFSIGNKRENGSLYRLRIPINPKNHVQPSLISHQPSMVSEHSYQSKGAELDQGGWTQTIAVAWTIACL